MNTPRFLGALAERPWLPAPPPPPAPRTAPAAPVGLSILLGVVATLFALLILALLIRAQLPDWAALAGAPDSPLASLAPLWANTAVLLAGSVAMQWASHAARRGQAAGPARTAFALGGLCALAFLAGQGWVWQRLAAAGHLVANGPALSFFYLLTGLHGLHLAGGLVAWGRAARRLWRPAAMPPPRAAALGVTLCARYWHFLFALWLVLFALLASPPPALRALAEICGIR